MGEDKSGRIKILAGAAAVACSAALALLAVCTFLLSGGSWGGRLLKGLIPLWMAVFFFGLCVLLERFSYLRSHKRVRIAVQAGMAILAGALLRLWSIWSAG